MGKLVRRAGREKGSCRGRQKVLISKFIDEKQGPFNKTIFSYIVRGHSTMPPKGVIEKSYKYVHNFFPVHFQEKLSTLYKTNFSFATRIHFQFFKR